MEIYKGNIVYSKSKDELVCLKDSYIIVDRGKVLKVSKSLPLEYKDINVVDFKEKIIIPAFSDLHVHAPQYPNRGIYMDKLLYNWLNDYTFPLEAKYKDLEFSKKVYTKFINDLIDNGTLHASIYGTIHKESTNFLIKELEKREIKSFVGKVNMDINSPSYLIEDKNESIRDTIDFILKNKDNKYARPILTPRFAPSCSFDLILGLGEVAKKYNINTQTHIVESLWEKEEAKKCFSGCRCDMEIYEKANLLKNKPFLAGHFIFPSSEDINLLKENDGYAISCPNATVNVIAGIMSLGRLLDMGIKIGFGSDLSAGEYIGINRAVSNAIRLAKIKNFYEKDERTITFEEAFYVATYSGGLAFGKCGSFLEGFDFDALVIDDMKDDFYDLSLKECVERFCYIGTKENIKHKFLRGKEIK